MSDVVVCPKCDGWRQVTVWSQLITNPGFVVCPVCGGRGIIVLPSADLPAGISEASADEARGILEFMAVECESGVIETECDEQGKKLPRAVHDERVARDCRRVLAILAPNTTSETPEDRCPRQG